MNCCHYLLTFNCRYRVHTQTHTDFWVLIKTIKSGVALLSIFSCVILTPNYTFIVAFCIVALGFVSVFYISPTPPFTHPLNFTSASIWEVTTLTLILVLFFFWPLSLPSKSLSFFLLSAFFSHRLSLSLSLAPSLLLLQPKHQDTFSLASQRPLTTINPIGHSLHPNGAPTLKPSPVPRTIQAMPWEQRSLYNQWDPREPAAPLFIASTTTSSHPPLPPPLSTSFGPSIKEGGVGTTLHRLTPPLELCVWERGQARWELVEIDYWVVRFKKCVALTLMYDLCHVLDIS